MTETEILSRSDCFNCGAEATYEKEGDMYFVECCNIDCRVSTGRFACEEVAASFPDPNQILAIQDRYARPVSI